MAFLAFEGIDGCGKSTLISGLSKALHTEGIDHYLTREPGGTPLAEEIRSLLIRVGDEIPHPRTEMLLYQAARAQHVEEVIRPKLDAGLWVVTDRFTASTYAFQAGGRGIDKAAIGQLNNYATGGVEPDLFILLDLSVEKARARRAQRSLNIGEPEDRFEQEKLDFHTRVRESYLEQVKANKNKWLVLDAQLSPKELLSDLLNQLKIGGWLK